MLNNKISFGVSLAYGNLCFCSIIFSMKTLIELSKSFFGEKSKAQK
jgi:hypothetical protein